MPVSRAKLNSKDIFGMHLKTKGLNRDDQNKYDGRNQVKGMEACEYIQKGTGDIISREIHVDVNQIYPRIPLGYQKSNTQQSG